MDVQVHGIITTEEILALQVVDDELLELRNDSLKLSDLLFVLESGKKSSPEVCVDKLVKLKNLELHLSSLHGGVEVCWFGLVWPHWNALTWLVVPCELGNDCRLVDNAAIWSLQNGNKTAVDVFVPLSLFPKVDIAFLEFDFFGP